MSLRSLCVVSLSKENFGEILFFRIFPTVERRCKLLYNKKYIALPPPFVIINSLLIKLGLSVSSQQFVEWRDKANGCMQLPIMDVKVCDFQVWPVLSVIQGSLMVCCLPFVENTEPDCKDNLLQIPSIFIGFSVLRGILNFLDTKSHEERTTQYRELDNFVTLSMPFGVPSEIEMSCASQMNYLHKQSLTKKQLAWKPFDFKGKQQICFKILEYVRCLQSDQNRRVCHYEVFGQISACADLEGTQNDVTVVISSSDLSHALSLESITLHPCVHMHGISASTPASNLLRRLRFSPPLQEFILLQYCSPELKEPPIQGVFKMLGERSVELLMQLKLSEKIKNSFDYCDVVVVFFNRGQVNNLEFTASYGLLKLSDDKHSLKWNIGTKFPRELEVLLTAKLDFNEEPILPKSDPFCIDKNSYAQINFKQNNCTLSGCSIDPKSIIVSQNVKPKVIIERSVQSIEYRFWNNYGDLPFPTNVEEKFETLFV